MRYSWILDSGGAGRGAWQGGMIYECMRWCREHDCYPTVTMGASAGGYAAADVATGTERTVMKGWTVWGTREQLHCVRNREGNRRQGRKGFRKHLHASIRYVMEDGELRGIFNGDIEKKLVVFTTRVRRTDGSRFAAGDRWRYFLKSATRKMSQRWKYLPGIYREDPVIYATNLPEELCSEYVRPLHRENYHSVIEASCLVPMVMGRPLEPEDLCAGDYGTDHNSVFLDGGYALKMPMGLFAEDRRFRSLARWAAADKTVVFCCDPVGRLWENTSRTRCLNDLPEMTRAVDENRLLVLYPDHKVEAGFLCTDNPTIMRTFNRGREQAERLLRSDRVHRFFNS